MCARLGALERKPRRCCQPRISTASLCGDAPSSRCVPGVSEPVFGARVPCALPYSSFRFHSSACHDTGTRKKAQQSSGVSKNHVPAHANLCKRMQSYRLVPCSKLPKRPPLPACGGNNSYVLGDETTVCHIPRPCRGRLSSRTGRS